MASRNNYGSEAKEREELLSDSELDNLPLARPKNTIVPKATWRFLAFALILLVFINLFLLFWLFTWSRSSDETKLVTSRSIADHSVTRSKLAQGIAGYGLTQSDSGELSLDENPSPRLHAIRSLLPEQLNPVDHARTVLGADGLAIIATSNASAIALTRCLTPACTYSTTNTLFSAGEHNKILSFTLLLSNWGNPLFAASTGQALTLTYCQDAKCAHKVQTIELARVRGEISAVQSLLNGRNPSFVYIESVADDEDVLYFVTCVDPGCYSPVVKNNITSLAAGSILSFSAALSTDSLPLISVIFASKDATAFHRYHCLDSQCAKLSKHGENLNAGVRTLQSLRAADGHVLLSAAGIHDNKEGIFVSRCEEEECSRRSDLKPVVLASDKDVKYLLIGSQLDSTTGFPYFLFDAVHSDHSSTHGLRFAFCEDSFCNTVKVSLPLPQEIYAFSNSLATAGEGTYQFVAKTAENEAIIIHATQA